MIRVAVTGSECTGKTTLASGLAKVYGAPLVPEYVREYVRRTGVAPSIADVESIAGGLIRRQDELIQEAHELLILDTDLLSTWVYSRHYYGACPHWIDDAVNERAADLYLLAHIDVPWVADGAQRDRGHMRREMQTLFRDELIARSFDFVEVRGMPRARLEAATMVIDERLKSPSPRPPGR